MVTWWQVTYLREIKGKEVGWPLGAMLFELDGCIRQADDEPAAAAALRTTPPAAQLLVGLMPLVFLAGAGAALLVVRMMRARTLRAQHEVGVRMT